MSLYQYLRRHLTVVLGLLLVGYGIVAFIHIACPQRIGQPIARGAQIAFAPVYNENGSAFHAVIGIGYRQGLLIFESIITLLCLLLMYKIVLYYSIFFGMRSWWSYFLDFGCASAIARLPVRLAGIYVLDYLYLRVGHSAYDFFDFCIGICIAGMVIWLIPACVKYYQYKKACTKGMRFWGKFKWEMLFCAEMLKMLFRPLKTWWKDVD